MSEPGDYVTEFALDDSKVEEYRKAMRLHSFTELISALSFYILSIGMLGFLWNIMSYPFTALNEQIPLPSFVYPYKGAAPISEAMYFGLIFIVGLIILMLFLRVSGRFQATAHSTGVDSKALALNILSRGVIQFDDNEFEEAIILLEEFNDLDEKHISSKLAYYIDNYIENVNSPDSDYFKNTYRDMVSIVMEEVIEEETGRQKYAGAIAEPERFERFEDEEDQVELEETHKVSYYSIVKNSLLDARPASLKGHFWLIYLVAAGIGVSVFIIIDKTLGIMTIMILLTGLQIYDRRGRRGGGE